MSIWLWQEDQGGRATPSQRALRSLSEGQPDNQKEVKHNHPDHVKNSISMDDQDHPHLLPI